MKILVVDVPAEVGGALTILENFYLEIPNDQNEWIFILSTPELKSTNNVKIRNYQWVKKSWFHRLFFDYIICPIIIKNENADLVVSLQNVLVPLVRVPQILYVHQPLPFISYRFGLKENYLFWLYQNIISKKILKSIKKAQKVIVQTEWMKKSILNKTGINESKIIKSSPKIEIESNEFFEVKKSDTSVFFFPSSSIAYKNHRIILEAVKILKEEGVVDLKVFFTINPLDNSYASYLYNYVIKENLPVEFIGYLSKKKLDIFYKKNVLLFSSNIETFGLPLLEAKVRNTPILCVDEYFSKEILSDYKNVIYFQWNDSEELASKMRLFIENKILYKDRTSTEEDISVEKNRSLYNVIVDIIKTERKKM